MISRTMMQGLAAGFAVLAGMGIPSSVMAKEPPRKSKASGSGEPSLIVARIWKDGGACPHGVARLRRIQGTQLDMSRYVDIGYIMSFDSKSQLQASAELFKDTLTFNFSRIVDDMTYKEIKDRFVSIAPGTYAVTSIACDYTNKKVWMGADKPTLFSDETGQAVPIKGTNVIEVRAGEILDAGILEIRSDEVGFFETKTASIVSALTPADQQASLRETFRDMSRKLRFATFTQRAGF